MKTNIHAARAARGIGAAAAVLLSGVAGLSAARAGAPTAVVAGASTNVHSSDDVRQLILSAPSALLYPNAAKATLLDLADITVQPDGTTRTITRQAIKVFNKLGRESEAEVKIPYTGGYETVKVLEARTIRPDGTVVNVQPQDVRDHELNDESGEYTDARVVSFSMPAVEDGCIIDYQYETVQAKSQMAGQFFTDWYFQDGTDPVMLTRLTITAPKDLKMVEQYENTPIRATEKPASDGKSVVYTWQQKDVAPIEVEPMMPPADKIIPAMHLTTISNWQDIADWYGGLANSRMVADDAVRAKTQELIKGLTTPEEKARAIYYYVEESTRYVALDFGESAYQPHPAAETCEKQYGDCKDMATLLVAMLREAGVTAYPVLLKVDPVEQTRDELPSPGAFNHAICVAEIDGKQYWLDATAQVCAWGQIPDGDRGADAFVIRNGKGTFEQIPYASPEEDRRYEVAKIALNPDGSAAGSVTLQGNGEWDLEMRSQLSYLTEDRIKPFLQSLAQNMAPDARVTNYTLSDVTNKDEPVKITFNVEFPFWASRSGDLLLFRARPEQTGGGESSPLHDDERKLPIVRDTAGEGASELQVTLPAGYTLFSAPDATTTVESDLGRFTRSVTIAGNTVTIDTRGDDFRAEVPASKYENVRHYFESFQRAADELVIVKKSADNPVTALAP